MSIDLTQDFFTLFGLHRRYAIDDAALEARATALRIAALPSEVARANKRTLRQLQRGGPTEAERAAHFDYADSQVHRDGVMGFLARQGGSARP